MRKLTLALAISIFFIPIMMALPHAHAAPASAKKKLAAPSPSPSPSPIPMMPAVAASPSPSPNTFLSHFKLSYYGEVQGPRFSNLNLAYTQGPSDPAPSYSEWDHAVKIGYGVSKSITLGTEIDAVSSFDPTQGLTFNDIQPYAAWAHMVETQDLDLTGVLKLGIPTTSASRNKGKIISIKIQNVWTLKTSLRNWTFMFFTKINPIFYNSPMDQTDMALGLYPYFTLDLSPSIQLMIEAGFDTKHNYNDAAFDFGHGGDGSVDVGPIFNIGSHYSITSAIRFFTANALPQYWCPYLNFSAAL